MKIISPFGLVMTPFTLYEMNSTETSTHVQMLQTIEKDGSKGRCSVDFFFHMTIMSMNLELQSSITLLP